MVIVKNEENVELLLLKFKKITRSWIIFCFYRLFITSYYFIYTECGVWKTASGLLGCQTFFWKHQRINEYFK